MVLDRVERLDRLVGATPGRVGLAASRLAGLFDLALLDFELADILDFLVQLEVDVELDVLGLTLRTERVVLDRGLAGDRPGVPGRLGAGGGSIDARLLRGTGLGGLDGGLPGGRLGRLTEVLVVECRNLGRGRLAGGLRPPVLVGGRLLLALGRVLGEIRVAGPGRRPERLVLQASKLLLGGALAPLQVEMLSDRVVENAHQNTPTG